MGRNPWLTNSYVVLWEACRQILPTLLLLFPFSLPRKSCLLVISLLSSNALKHFNISVYMGNIISVFPKSLKTYHQPQDLFFRLWLVLFMSRANETIQKNSFNKLHLCLLISVAHQMHHGFLKFLVDLKFLWKTPYTEFLMFQSFLSSLLQTLSVSASSLWLYVNQESCWDWLEHLPSLTLAITNWKCFCMCSRLVNFFSFSAIKKTQIRPRNFNKQLIMDMFGYKDVPLMGKIFRRKVMF